MVDRSVHLVLQCVKIVPRGIKIKIGRQQAIFMAEFQNARRRSFAFRNRRAELANQGVTVEADHQGATASIGDNPGPAKPEDRRVGKEWVSPCRSRWSPVP